MSGSGRTADLLRRLAPLILLAWPSALAAKVCPPLQLRAMSYNIRLDIASDGANAWPHRRNDFIGQIELVRPDLIGLQEVVPGQRQDLMVALPGFEFLGVARDDGKGWGEYSPIGVRRSAYRIVASGTYWLSETPDQPSLGWDAAFRRIVTWARLKHRRTGAGLLVLNTHWDHQGLVAREKSAALIRSWLASNLKPDEQLILLGDFNAPLPESSMQQLLASDLRDSRQEAGSTALGPSATFNNFELLPPAADPIDHILVGPRWQVIRQWVIAQHVDGRLPSDHYPIVADLEANLATCL